MIPIRNRRLLTRTVMIGLVGVAVTGIVGSTFANVTTNVEPTTTFAQSGPSGGLTQFLQGMHVEGDPAELSDVRELKHASTDLVLIGRFRSIVPGPTHGTVHFEDGNQAPALHFAIATMKTKSGAQFPVMIAVAGNPSAETLTGMIPNDEVLVVAHEIGNNEAEAFEGRTPRWGAYNAYSVMVDIGKPKLVSASIGEEITALPVGGLDVTAGTLARQLQITVTQ
jgi:hypothetical protein